MKIIIFDEAENLLGSTNVEPDAAMWLMDPENPYDWTGKPIEVEITAGNVGGPRIYKVCEDDGDVLFEGGIGDSSARGALDGTEHVFRFERTGWCDN